MEQENEPNFLEIIRSEKRDPLGITPKKTLSEIDINTLI